MPLATRPSISCPSGSTPVVVIASDGVRPIQNAKVTILSTYSVMGIVIDSKRHDLSTNIAGLAEVCEENRLTKSYAVEAWIQKSNVDFGSGSGKPYRVGSAMGLVRVAMPFTLFKAITTPTIPPIPELPLIPEIIPELPPTPESIPDIPRPPAVCTAWETVASPTVPATLSPSFPISVSGAKWKCGDTSELIDGIGKIEFGGRTFDLPIQSGYGRVNLEDVMDLDTLTGLKDVAVSTIKDVSAYVPETVIPTYISPKESGSTTITLYLADYIQKGVYTPIRGAYWGAGFHDRKAGSYEIHKASDARGTSDRHYICKLNVPKQFGDYTVTIVSVQNLGTQSASYTVRIQL